MADKEKKEKDTQPRIVIDCTVNEHGKVKSYCATKHCKMKEFALKAVFEKMEREP